MSNILYIIFQHDDFLTKSITNMKEILKKDPVFSSEDTLTYSDGEESDVQSLGERIARAAISSTDCKGRIKLVNFQSLFS